MKRTRSETMSRVEDLRTCCELGNNGFLFCVHFLHQPFYRVSQKIRTEFIRLRLTHWLLSGDMNLSIVALVDFLWFQENHNTFSLLFVSRQQDKWIKIVSNNFRMSSRCFSMILIPRSWNLGDVRQEPEARVGNKEGSYTVVGQRLMIMIRRMFVLWLWFCEVDFWDL